MLTALRDRAHQVYTAVCVIAGDDGRKRDVSASDVTMRPYTDAEIAAYVATGDPLDKAGAYAIQDPLFSPVAGVGRAATRASWGCRWGWSRRCWPGRRGAPGRRHGWARCDGGRCCAAMCCLLERARLRSFVAEEEFMHR